MRGLWFPDAAVAAPLVVVLAAGACAPVYSHSAAVGPPPAGHRASPEAPTPRLPPPALRESGLAGLLGTLVWPLAMDRASLLSSVYGRRAHPRSGGERFHAGLDLRAGEGTPVYAVAAGRVAASGVAGAYGNRIIVDHGSGLHSLYAHHRRNLVAEGQEIRRGQVIALVGHTGNATGDHLHFELRWKGGTVDPWTVLPPLQSDTRK